MAEFCICVQYHHETSELRVELPLELLEKPESTEFFCELYPSLRKYPSGMVPWNPEISWGMEPFGTKNSTAGLDTGFSWIFVLSNRWNRASALFEQLLISGGRWLPVLDKSKEGDVTKVNSELFVICDKKAIPISGNICMALELLFYVFDVHYPEYLRPLYEFGYSTWNLRKKGLKASIRLCQNQWSTPSSNSSKQLRLRLRALEEYVMYDAYDDNTHNLLCISWGIDTEFGCIVIG